jgi:exoribonuclease-2
MIVEFLADDGSFRLGLVDGPADVADSWLVTNSASGGQTEQLRLSSQEITFCWPTLHNGNPYRFALADLMVLSETIQADIETRRSRMPIQYSHWVDANRRTVNVTTAANMLFERQALPHEIYVTHRLLQESHAFVRPGKLHPGTAIVNEYTLNSLSVMSSINKIFSKEKESIERKIFLHRFARKLWAAENKQVPLSSVISTLPDLTETERSFNLNWNPHQDSHYLNKMKAYALADENSDPNELQMIQEQFLGPLSIEPDSKVVFNVLVKIGVFGRYENPFIGRHNGKLDFTALEKKAFRSQAAQLAFVDRDSKLRRDYRNCGPVFAIDSRLESDEIDDAVGLFRAPDGTTWVHIHIADPSRFVNPNDSLDLLARQRVSSLFIPEKIATMFPPNFSRQHFSLLPDKINHALTFAVQLNPTTGQVMNYDISPSFIDKVVAMTYDQADDLLVAASRKEAPTLHKPVPASQVSALNTLLELSEARRRHRERAGAVFLDQPRPEVEVIDSGEIIKVASVRDSESLTRGMVSEFMILVGEVTALFASRNNIPIPFRSQAKRPSQAGFVPASSSGSLSSPAAPALAPLFEPPVSPLKSSRPKSTIHGSETQPRLFPALTDVNPGEHAGLGLPAYCQATSPIRRYTDLLVHHQIKSYLRGESFPFSSAKISSMISQLESTQMQLNMLSNNSNRYWILRYLERQDPERIYEALVAGDSMFGVQCAVWLLELGWKTSIMVDSGRSPVRGEKIQVRVHHVDAFKDEIVLMEDTPAASSSSPPPSPL